LKDSYMYTKAKTVQGKYLDSVKLMLISKELRAMDEVEDAVVILATGENKQILAATNMLVDEIKDAAENEIVIVVKAASPKAAEQAMLHADSLLEAPAQNKNKARSHSLSAAYHKLDPADLCLISVAGKYAAAQAHEALNLGMHVMLFSDNVSLKDELALKQKALSKGLLMMGPDCGTAIINGCPLAFANDVPRGGIGIVASSGTGLQEITCGIANRGFGISQALGTGGRDGQNEIGGLMLLAGLDYLMQDEETKCMVLIAKTPDQAVLDKIWQKLADSNKPVIVNFLQLLQVPKLPQVSYCTALDETALLACQSLGYQRDETQAEDQLPQISPGRRYIRGLYSGGTLCYEAQQLYYQYFDRYPHSNVALHSAASLANAMKPEADSFIDMGSDEFTVGRPHPMIDFSVRLSLLKALGQDNETAIFLLDVVLGYGAHPDPASELVPVLRTLPPEIIVICNVLGTATDPQDAAGQVQQIKSTGAHVFRSHHAAADFAMQILSKHREEK